ncbi:MAG: biopolymer transporter ExbD [Chromatiales bacterium]|nr:biopolymer transporter ExbD [Chromatiales bacterium]
MNFVRNRVRRDVLDDHLIPLINVIFLMLIFFMVVGRIAPPESLAVAPPVSRLGESVERQERLLILSADGRIAHGDEIVERAALPERLGVWLAEWSAASAPLELTLKADARMRAEELHAILAQLRAAGVAKVSLITAGAPEAVTQRSESN